MDDLAEEKLYRIIEQKYKFTFPPAYRLMRQNGWMTLRRPVDPATFVIPGNNYLYLYDMEWYSLEEIATHKFPSYTSPRLPGLVPFAFTGGGDAWCWQTTHSMRVLLCCRDSYDGTWYAPDFGSALFRQALAHASIDISHDPNPAEAITQAKAALARWAVDLKPILPSQWCDILQRLSLRKAVKWTWTSGNGKVFKCLSLLSTEERRQIENEELRFPEIDQDIRWQNLE